MREDVNFPKAIANYIQKTTLENLQDDSFVLLVEIFSTSNFKEVTTENFITTLFDFLNLI